MAAGQRARTLTDRQLKDAGWSVQSRSKLNLFAGPGVAVREVIMAPGHGRADCLLYEIIAREIVEDLTAALAEFEAVAAALEGSGVTTDEGNAGNGMTIRCQAAARGSSRRTRERHQRA